MSFHYYPAGVYGMKVEDLFPPDVAKEILVAYRAAEFYNEDELLEDPSLDDDEPVYKERYAKVMEHFDLVDFNNDPSGFVSRAFKKECEKYIPGYRKMKRLGGFHRADSDAIGDVEGGEVMFGVGVYQFPLERTLPKSTRGYRIPEEFMEKARMTIWMVGG